MTLFCRNPSVSVHVDLLCIHELQVFVNSSAVRPGNHGIAILFQFRSRLLSRGSRDAAAFTDHALHEAFGQAPQLHQGKGILALLCAIADLDRDLVGIDVLLFQALYYGFCNACTVAEALAVG